MKTPSSDRRTWIGLFLMLTLGMGASALWIAETQIDNELARVGSQQQRTNTVSSLVVSNELTRGLSLLAQLRRDDRVIAAMQPTVPTAEVLAELFKSAVILNPRVSQARWIDRSGWERVRIDRIGNQVIRRGQTELQNKSARDYFQAAEGLSDEAIWVSSIDLNEENGQVERPFRPTVRMVTTLPGNAAAGFMVFNFDAQPLIDRVIESAADPETVGFLDHGGHWILGPLQADTWTHQLKVEAPDLGPAFGLLPQLNRSRNGVLRQSFGLVTWSRVELGDVGLPVISPTHSVLTQWPAERVGQIVSRYRGIALIGVLLILVPVAYLLRRLFLAQIATRRATLAQLKAERQARLELEHQAEQLLQSNRDLDAFAYAAAHDLRTPLRAITQYAGILREDLTELPPEYLGYVQRMADLSESLDKMLRGLLSYSRLGAVGGQSEVLDLCELIPPMARLYTHDDFEVVVDTPHSVNVPKVLIEMIIRNVVMNAVKHHHKDQGTLRFNSRRQGDWVTLFCSDDGPGIDQSNWEEVFLVFRKLKSSSLVEHEGLGLAMVRRAAESMGGSAWIESSSAEGTCFAVKMPAAN